MGKKENTLAARFGRQLQMIRVRAGLKQEDVARSIGLGTQNTITRLERGVATGITFRVLQGLLDFAKEHGVSARELLSGRKPMLGAPRGGEEGLAWLATASREELLTAIFRPIELQVLIEQQLRVVDDPDMRRDIVLSLDPHAFDERRLVLPAARGAPAGAPSRKGRVPRARDEGTRAAPADIEPPAAAGGKAAERRRAPRERVMLAEGAVIVTTYEAGYRIVDAEQLPADWRGRYVPVLGRLSAGEGVDTVEAEEHPPGWATSYLIYTGAPAAGFALRVIGDSMEPDHRDGDMVVVDGSQPVRSGVCCVIYARNGDRVARLKRLRISKGKAHLESTNPNHPAVIVPAKTTEAFKVIAHLPALVATQARMPASLDRPFTGPLTGR